MSLAGSNLRFLQFLDVVANGDDLVCLVDVGLNNINIDMVRSVRWASNGCLIPLKALLTNAGWSGNEGVVTQHSRVGEVQRQGLL